VKTDEKEETVYLFAGTDPFALPLPLQIRSRRKRYELPFVFLQAGQFHLGLHRIGSMNGDGIMPQRFLRKALRISDFVWPSRPRARKVERQ
jgi:hypothetical protein